MLVILSPQLFSARTADSRPGPGPPTRTSTFLTPCSCAATPAFSAATWAANGVDLREPRKPQPPEVAQESVFPWRSVIVMIVLLKEACTCAIASSTFLRAFLGFLALAALLFAAAAPCLLSAISYLPLRLARRCIELHCLLTRALTSAGIRPRALAAHREPATVTDAPVRAEVHQPLDIHGHFTTQVAFHRELRNLRADGVYLGLGEVFHLRVRIDVRTFTGGLRASVAHTVYVREPDPHVL